MALDLVIRNGRVVDGSGAPARAADVGIDGGRVVEVGRVGAARVALDAAGLVVAPGFVDVHVHVEDEIEALPLAANLVADGVTSIVTGNCGQSRVDVGALFARLAAAPAAVNVGSLVGHNAVRAAIIGHDARPPEGAELAQMEALVEGALRAGALGLSTGLIYAPGMYADAGELVALARVAARHGGLYASHVRSESDRVHEAIDEALAIGREARVPVQISHLKITNRKRWGESARILERLRRARAEGIDVAADQYPYAATSTTLAVLLPNWALAGGPEALRARLATPETRRRIAREMHLRLRHRAGRGDLSHAVIASCAFDGALEGKSLSEVTRLRGRRSGLAGDVATALELVERGGAAMVFHTLHEEDVDRILRAPEVMIASDGGVVDPGDGVPHPRNYGTRARVLGRYVRERGALSLEEAIRKMTSLPAGRFGLANRGRLAPGAHADVVVFDEAAIVDHSSFERPHAPSAGIRHVLVNGVEVWRDGRHTGARPGAVLRLAPPVTGG